MTTPEFVATPTRPYLTRAIYEWINDNRLTPHLLVNATVPNTMVPEQFIQDGQIVLNIAPHAVHALHMSNDAISFSARFGGVSRDLYIPMAALVGIYARENGQGLFFDPNEYDDIQNDADQVESKPEEVQPKKKKPSLRIVDE